MTQSSVLPQLKEPMASNIFLHLPNARGHFYM